MSIAATDIGTIVPPVREPAKPALTPVPAYTTTKTAVHDTPPVKEPARKRTKSDRDWRTGWCGPGPECGDNQPVNGEPVRRCLGFCVNGSKAAHPISYCACVCHADQDPA